MKHLAPIVIAITGHRDILNEHHNILKNKIKNIIAGLKKENINTHIIFLSPLAEGSDQLGAIVALEMGCELIVPLPMEKTVYLEAFNESSKYIFEKLLYQAKKSFVLDCPKCLSKEDYYLNLGKYLVQNSNILLALWDGKYSDKIGGTGYIIKHIDELKATPSILRKVIHLWTPRKSNPIIEDRFQIDEINIISS